MAKKRGNGEGNIYRRADGSYEARVSLPGGRRKSVYGKTRAEAQRKMTALLRDVQQGVDVPTGRLSVGAFLERWLEDSVKPKNSFRTYESYRGLVTNHLIPGLGGRSLASLSAPDVQRFLTEKGRNASPSLVKHIRDVLRIALGQAKRWRVVAFNAAADTDPPRVEKHVVRPLTRDEATSIRQAFEGTPLEIAVLLGLTLGLRRAEVCGLRWADVDLERAKLTVRYQLQRQDKEWQFVPPKSKESRRTVPMPAFIAEALHAHRVTQLEDRLRLGAAWSDHDLVFPTAVGTPYDPMNLLHRFQARLTKAGLPAMRFHDLRHGAATVLLNNGFTLKEVQVILGHSTFRMTSDLYAHISEDVSREWSERMQSAFGG